MPCGDDHEMVDQLLHLHQHALLGRQDVLAVDHVDRAVGQFVERLFEDTHALAHFFQPHQIAVVAIADRADGNVEVVVLVVEIRMLLAQVVIDAGAAQVRA